MSRGFWKNPQEKAPTIATAKVRTTTDSTTLQPKKARHNRPIAGRR